MGLVHFVSNMIVCIINQYHPPAQHQVNKQRGEAVVRCRVGSSSDKVQRRETKYNTKGTKKEEE